MPPFPRAVCVCWWVGVPPSSSILQPRALGARCRVLGSSSDPLLHTVGMRCRVRGPPPPSPPWWPNALSARNRSGGICSLLPSSCMPRTRSACCPLLSPVSVSLHPYYVVPVVAPWLSPFTRGPALARPPSGSSGASISYSRRECVLPSALSDCRRWGPALSSSAAVPQCGCGRAVIPDPRVMPLLPPSAPLSLLAQVVEGFRLVPAPVRSPPSLPH